MTIMELTDALGLANNGHVSLLENGKRMPSITLLLKIAHLFKVTTDQLLEDDLELPDEDTEGR